MRQLWRARQQALVLLLTPLALLYAACVVVTVAPPSPAQIRLTGYSDQLMSPYFTQNWRLFAPDPPAQNTTAYYQIRYRQGGETLVTNSIELSGPVLRASRTAGGLPSRFERVVSNMNLQLARTQSLRRDLRTALDRATKAPARDTATIEGLEQAIEAIEEQITENTALSQRLLSAIADRRLSGAGTRIVEVRYEVYSRPVRPFSLREQEWTPDQIRTYSGPWLPYVPGVTL
jgi:hypothetical protein